MNDEPLQAPKRCKPNRWFRFSIRSALIATMIVAVFLGYRTNIARREKPAIDSLMKHGCSPLYQHDIFGNIPSFAPRSVREAIGVEHFGSVVRLNFADGYPSSDEGFSMLKQLPDVIVVNTNGASLTDAGIAPISHLTQLNILRLTNAKNVTDLGLKHLANLTDLALLDLSGTGITDQGLRELRNLHHIETLSLNNTLVSDRGIMELRHMKRLQLLKLQGTKVTPQGVGLLKNELPNCQIDFTD